MQCLQLEIAAQLKFRLYTKMELTKKTAPVVLCPFRAELELILL